MKWRDILIGAFLTLAVTVVGGVLVWYLTKEPHKKAPEEILVYQIDAPAKFSSNKNKLSFYQIRLENIGTIPASNVSVAVDFVEKAKIVDTSLSFSTGSAARKPSITTSTPSCILFEIDSFVPNETATVSLMVDTVSTIIPSVAIKSDKTIGKLSSSVEKRVVQQSSKKESRVVTGILIPLAILSQMFLLFRFRNALGGFRSINNAAFMYIHQGLNEEASIMLKEQIKKDGATSFELANLGLCLGLDGDNEKAEKHFSAAEFYTSSGPGITSLIAFNRGIVAYKNSQHDEAVKCFKVALSKSKRRIKKYASYSVIMKDIFANNSAIDELFKK